MLDCWAAQPEQRPEFGEIVRRVDEIIEKLKTDISPNQSPNTLPEGIYVM
jgi:hypothetical protein